MRARNLKPGFFKNDLLAECSPLARLLFAGLWCLADREGRLEYRPKKIKAEILPYDDCNVAELIEQLKLKGFVVVYQHEEQIYLEIPAFTRHQNCHIKEPESTIPAPCENSTCTVVARPLTESLLPHTEPLLPSPVPKRARKKSVSLGRFQDFWDVYPKKRNRGDAESAWTKINPDDELVEKMIQAVNRFKQSEDWKKEEGQFIPYPATWLNRKGWEDSLEIELPKPRRYFSPVPSPLEQMKADEERRGEPKPEDIGAVKNLVSELTKKVSI